MARVSSTKVDGSAFDGRIIEAVWQKGAPDPPFYSFRRDACGAPVQRARYGQHVQWGWEIDHIIPVARGGTDDLENLQPLQWENNQHKSDDYPTWDCKVRG